MNGFSIDFIGRETLPLNDRIITLSALGLSSNNDEYNTFNKQQFNDQRGNKL